MLGGKKARRGGLVTRDPAATGAQPHCGPSENTEHNSELPRRGEREPRPFHTLLSLGVKGTLLGAQLLFSPRQRMLSGDK